MFTTYDLLQILLFLGLLIGLTPVLGSYMYKVFTGGKHIMLPVFGWFERLTYKFIKVNPDEETNWKTYTFGLITFNLIGFIFVFLIQMTQAFLPMNPAHLPNVSWHLAFNTAVSFMTNTNWLRLRSVSLTYSLPGSIIAKQNVIKSLSVSVIGTNLLLFTNYKGMDPESSAAGAGVAGSSSVGIDYAGVPATAGCSVGLNVTF